MLESRGELDLAEESLGAEAAAEVGTHDLERHLTAVAQVPGDVDRGHAARPELPLDLVASGQRRGEALHDIAHEKGNLARQIGLEESLALVLEDAAANAPAQGEVAAHLEERPAEGAGGHVGGERMRHADPERHRIALPGADQGEPLGRRGAARAVGRLGACVVDAAEAEDPPHAEGIDQGEKEG